MWYPATVSGAPTEPVTLEQAKRHVSATDFADDDELLGDLIASARDHAEKYCGTRFATQNIVVKCDSFADFSRLSEAPIQSVTSIEYVDTAGATQTLGVDVYEVRGDGLEVSIVKKYGQTWPPIQPGSRISVTAVAGYEIVPPAVRHAILLWVADSYRYRETTVPDGYKFREYAGDADWTAFDTLLTNYRR